MKLKMLQTLIANDEMLNPGDTTELFDGVDADRLIAWGFAEPADVEDGSDQPASSSGS